MSDFELTGPPAEDPNHDFAPEDTDNNATSGTHEWDSDEALAALTMERSVNPNESNEALAKRIVIESAPQAAMSLVQLALHARNENTRLNAAKYVVDKATEAGAENGKATWEKLMAGFLSETELHANGIANN